MQYFLIYIFAYDDSHNSVTVHVSLKIFNYISSMKKYTSITVSKISIINDSFDFIYNLLNCRIRQTKITATVMTRCSFNDNSVSSFMHIDKNNSVKFF